MLTMQDILFFMDSCILVYALLHAEGSCFIRHFFKDTLADRT